MVEEEGNGIEASGDSLVIADAIGYVGEGLHEIAKAIRELAKATAGDEYGEPEVETYLDGRAK